MAPRHSECGVCAFVSLDMCFESKPSTCTPVAAARHRDNGTDGCTERLKIIAAFGSSLASHRGSTRGLRANTKRDQLRKCAVETMFNLFTASFIGKTRNFHLERRANQVGLMQTRDRDVNMAALPMAALRWRGQIELVSLYWREWRDRLECQFGAVRQCFRIHTNLDRRRYHTDARQSVQHCSVGQSRSGSYRCGLKHVIKVVCKTWQCWCVHGTAQSIPREMLRDAARCGGGTAVTNVSNRIKPGHSMDATHAPSEV